MTENDTDGDPLPGLGESRHETAASEIEKALNTEDEGDTATDASTGKSPTESGVTEDAGTEGESKEVDTETTEEGTNEPEDTSASVSGETTNPNPEEKPEYTPVSAYISGSVLSKYRHTYFERLVIDYPEVRGCEQREMQWALMSEGMQDENRKKVRDRAVKLREQREKQEQHSEDGDYAAVSVYLADPELSKYRYTYFNQLQIEFSKVQGCQQREMQKALLAEAMQDENRKKVRDRAVKLREQREQRE